MFEGDAVVEHLDKVGRDLDAGHVDDDRVGGVAGLGGPRVVEGDNPEPVQSGSQDYTPEIEASYMLFERSLSIFSMPSL